MKEAVKSIIKGAIGGSVVMNLYLLILAWFDLDYRGLMPCFEDVFGSGLVAAELQLMTFAVMGIAVSLCIFVRKQERMGLLLQSLCQYVVLGIGFLPICLISGMVKPEIIGILAYAGVLLLLYAVLWAAQMSAIKIKLNEMNAALAGKTYRGKFQVVPYGIIVFGIYYVIPAAIFLVLHGSADTIFTINLMNYFLYPILLFVVGVICGSKVGGIIWYTLASVILIVPISLFLYQELSYTVTLGIAFGVIAAISNLIGMAIKKMTATK